jgi:hypothetical protein
VILVRLRRLVDRGGARAWTFVIGSCSFASEVGATDARRRLWGYGVWGAFGLLVAVTELLGWLASDTVGFPTISSTTGDLEGRADGLGALVVAVIGFGAYGALRFPPSRTGVLPPKLGNTFAQSGSERETGVPYRTRSGRLTLSPTPVAEIGAGVYFGLALIVIGASTAAAAVASGGADKFAVGRTLYGLTALFWVVVPTLLALPSTLAVDVPFTSMFQTIRNIESSFHPVAYVIAAGLSVLFIHLALYPWPSVIPDVQRLDKTYVCHPLARAGKPLTKKQLEACKQLDAANTAPEPDAP